MEETQDIPSIDDRLARRLKGLRLAAGWSLDDLAARAGISRASLSRIENAEVSATAAVLGRLAAAHGLPMSRLIALAEEDFAARLRPADQPVWTDPATGFRRRQLSPPAATLGGEVLDCALPPATRIDYDRPPRPGLEHHLVLMTGRLRVTVEGAPHDLEPGDCLRYRLHGASRFETTPAEGARYHLFIL
ncbi:XRE family transcriptional regulator [Tistrella mobilis]|uniref:helix-turn-helix domain-containing protein n=1 Tax=Tistrella mobilis TaxID=171437 RepID=UPI003555F783